MKEVKNMMETAVTVADNVRMPYDTVVANLKWTGVIETSQYPDRKEAIKKRAEVIKNGK